MGHGEVETRDASLSIDIPDVASLDGPSDNETFYKVLCQVSAPFTFAGLGMVVAGLYLSKVQTWKVYKEVPEIIILVPSLLGLKGNLEMTLASRLSTEANLGRLDDKKQRNSLIWGNLVLVQLQALVVAFLASAVATLLVYISNHEFNATHSLFLCASSLITAGLASCFLSLLTAFVICYSRHLGVNPDNIATPIAASFGDITSLILFSYTASYLYSCVEAGGQDHISGIVIGVCCAMVAVFFGLARMNSHIKPTLFSGWIPVIVAMLISTFGGKILDSMVVKYAGLAVFQPVINGVGGNLVSVQASKLSTELHKKSTLGTLPADTKIFVSPLEAFLRKGNFSTTARALLTMAVPGHIVFVAIIICFEGTESSLLFIVLYLLVSVLQVVVLLYASYIITHLAWSLQCDPDNSTIPFLTALGDFLGIVLLGGVFYFLETIGQ